MPPPNNSPAATTDYNTAFGEMGNIYDPQTAQVQQALKQATTNQWGVEANLAADKKTSLSSLDQAKANAFKNFLTTSNDRGMFFSGYAPAQQQGYLTNTYNPNVLKVNTSYDRNLASSKANYANTSLTLNDKINQINQSRANAANSLVLNTKQAQQVAAEKAAAAAKSNAAIAKSAADAASKMDLNTFTSNVQAGLIKVMGGDKHVSPQDFINAKDLWVQKGLPASEFYNTYTSFINPSHIQDYVN